MSSEIFVLRLDFGYFVRPAEETGSTAPRVEPDFRGLLHALQGYADDGLDQWASWRMKSEFGDVFVSVTREPAPGAAAKAYDLVSPDMPLRTGRRRVATGPADMRPYPL